MLQIDKYCSNDTLKLPCSLKDVPLLSKLQGSLRLGAKWTFKLQPSSHILHFPTNVWNVCKPCGIYVVPKAGLQAIPSRRTEVLVDQERVPPRSLSSKSKS